MINVLSSAPTRIDIGGSTLDIDPLYKILNNTLTVNIAIDLRAVVKIEDSPDKRYSICSEDTGVRIDGSFEEIVSSKNLTWPVLIFKSIWLRSLPPIKIRINAGSPSGAGLGGSSCLGIALFGALAKARQIVDGSEFFANEHDMVAYVKDLETKHIRVPTGFQDYWGAVRGGINIIQFPPGKIKINTLKTGIFSNLSKELVLCYSGTSRASAKNNWEIFRSAFDENAGFLESLEAIGRKTEEIAKAILSREYSSVLDLSNEEWKLRKKLWPNIMTEKTIMLEQRALQYGAKMVRVCGAGGGGVMAVFVEEDKRQVVCDSLRESGGVILNAKVTDNGFQVQA